MIQQDYLRLPAISSRSSFTPALNLFVLRINCLKEARMLETAIVQAVIVDPRPLFCDAVRACLAKGGHIVVGQAQTLQDVLRQADSLRPNLAIIGPDLAEQDLSICRELSERLPTLKIILFTEHASDPLFLMDAAYVGVSGCVPPEITESEILAVIAQVMGGQQLFSREILADAFRPLELTARERDVLRFMAEGKTDREIAAALKLSYSTIRNHVQRILEKLSVHSRQQAVWRARHRGLV